MVIPSTAEDLQSCTLAAYTTFESLRDGLEPGGWAGAFILNVGLDVRGSALSLASNIAGAVCLSLESDVMLLRNAQRTGSCDFIVNTLDEAVRAMKNEIRKRRPLSVGLEGDPVTLLAQIIDRGLAPELFASPTAYPEAAAHFRSLETVLLSSDAAATSLEKTLTAHNWTRHTFSFANPAELRTFEAHATAFLGTEEPLRRNWLASAPRIFPRERTRTLWLTPAERDHLASIA